MTTFLKELRDTAMECTDPAVRSLLRDCADSVQVAIDALKISPTADRMVHLNSQWARAERTLREARTQRPTPPSAGAMSIPETCKAA